jgi:hypothetical protein
MNSCDPPFEQPTALDNICPNLSFCTDCPTETCTLKICRQNRGLVRICFLTNNLFALADYKIANQGKMMRNSSFIDFCYKTKNKPPV